MAPIDIGGAPVSLQELLGFQKNVQASNPYGIAGGALGAWQPDMSTWSLPTQGITAFGKSFLSGILGNVARNDAADQLSKVVGSLPQLRADPQNAAIPEGVDPAGYNALRGSAVINKMQNEAASSAQRQSNMGDLLKTVVGEGVKNGTIAPGAALKAVATGDYSGVLGDKMDASANPNSPQYKANQDTIDNEKALANDFAKAAAPFKYKEQGLKAVAEAYKDPAGTSDYELIRRGAQAIEPGLAVRTDDQESIQGAASVLGMTSQAVKSAISGDTKLTPEVRAGIMRLVQRSYMSSLQDYNTIRDSFLTRAERAKLDKNSVVPFGAGIPFEKLYPGLDISAGSGPSGLMDQKTFALDALAKGMTKEQARAAWAQYSASQGGGVY